MSSIPFQLPDVGLREISGSVYLDEEFLVFEVQDALLGEFDKEHQVIKIEPRALQEIRLDRGILRDRLYIRPKERDLLAVMPGTYQEELRFKIWNIHRGQAEQLVEEVQRRMEQVRQRIVPSGGGRKEASMLSVDEIQRLGFTWPGYALIEQNSVVEQNEIDLSATLERLQAGRAFYKGQLNAAFAFKQQTGADYSDFTDRFDEYARMHRDLGVAISYLQQIMEAAAQ